MQTELDSLNEAARRSNFIKYGPVRTPKQVEEENNLRTTIFSQHSPPANVYEFRLAPNGSLLPKEGRKNMENVNVNTIADQMALATELDATLSDAELEHILAISPEQFTQDEEDTDPTINEHIRGASRADEVGVDASSARSEEIEAKRPLDS